MRCSVNFLMPFFGRFHASPLLVNTKATEPVMKFILTFTETRTRKKELKA